MLGENDPSVATDESNLALIYEKENKYSDAETLYKKAIAIDEKSTDAAQIGLDLAGLGKLYADTGKYAQAEQTSQQELAAAVKAYGPQDARVASALNDLAADSALDGKLSEAEQAYGKAMVIAQKGPSPDQATIAQIEVNMGALYRIEGKYPQAESLMLQALASREKALGPNHPDVASPVLSSLGLLYEYEMRFSDAERALRQALDIDMKALGPASVQTAHDMVDLANLYGSHGQSGPADQLFYNAIQIYLKVVNQAPKQTANIVFQGAQQFLNDGNLNVAARLFNDAGGIYQQAEGANSAHVAKCDDNLGAIAEDMGRHDDAERLHKRAQAIFEQISGPDDTWRLPLPSKDWAESTKIRSDLPTPNRSTSARSRSSRRTLSQTIPDCARARKTSQRSITSGASRHRQRPFSKITWATSWKNSAQTRRP